MTDQPRFVKIASSKRKRVLRKLRRSQKLCGAGTILEIMPSPMGTVQDRIEKSLARFYVKPVKVSTKGVCHIYDALREPVISTRYVPKLKNSWVTVGDCLKNAMTQIEQQQDDTEQPAAAS
jgi:hypothetical protein